MFHYSELKWASKTHSGSRFLDLSVIIGVALCLITTYLQRVILPVNRSIA